MILSRRLLHVVDNDDKDDGDNHFKWKFVRTILLLMMMMNVRYNVLYDDDDNDSHFVCTFVTTFLTAVINKIYFLPNFKVFPFVSSFLAPSDL